MSRLQVETVKTLDNGVGIRRLSPVEENGQRNLVLLHGYGADENNWGGFPKALQRPITAIDAAKSDRLGKCPSMHDFAELTVDTIDEEVSDDKVDLLGFSWGGLAAQQIALDYPSRVNRLILAATVSGPYIYLPSPAAFILLAASNRTDELLMRYAGDAYGGKIRGNWKLVKQAGLGGIRNEVVRRRQESAAISAIYDMNWHKLGSMATETLLVTGDDDPLVRPEYSYQMKKRIPNAQIHIIEGEGHLFPMTSSKETAKAVNTFLDQD